MKGKWILLSLAVLACIGLASCNKDKDKTKDPLRSTTWTAYDEDDLMVLRFELGTISSFYIGDNNLNRLSPASGSSFTLSEDQTRISFTELNETAGMGMRVDEDEWKAQFAGVNTDSFTLNKAGGSTAAGEIDSVSGASTTSGAVVNAVNAGLDFFHSTVKGGN
jgi:hypothetical protein